MVITAVPKILRALGWGVVSGSAVSVRWRWQEILRVDRWMPAAYRGAEDEGDGAGFGSVQGVGDFGEPFVVVDGLALGGVAEPFGCEPEKEEGDAVEPAPEFLTHQGAQGGEQDGTEDGEGGPGSAR
jgi:hypothetical protein